MHLHVRLLSGRTASVDLTADAYVYELRRTAERELGVGIASLSRSDVGDLSLRFDVWIPWFNVPRNSLYHAKINDLDNIHIWSVSSVDVDGEVSVGDIFGLMTYSWKQSETLVWISYGFRNLSRCNRAGDTGDTGCTECVILKPHLR